VTDHASPSAAAGDGAISVTDSGAGTASKGGAVVTGVVIGDVTAEYHEHHHPAPSAPLVWPIQIGRPPVLASAFQPRQGLREQIHSAHRHGADVILAQQAASGSAGVLAGGGGVGKTQLAAWFAHRAIDEQSTDLVVWVPASTEDQIVTTFARAAAVLAVPGARGADTATDAAAFCEWLHTTSRTWLVVLDDVTDPAGLARWWPPARPQGWTLATTRLRTATLTSSGRRRIDIDVYSPAESLAYLTDRLTGENLLHLLDARAADLAAALGHLPLALSHAAAYMINEDESCGGYLHRYTDGRQQLAELMPDRDDPDAYGRPVAVTLLLNVQAAEQATPAGLARPALALAALLDPTGHPDSLWTTPAVAEYLAAQRPGEPVAADHARAVLRLLHRYGLVTHTPADGARAVRIHALTARAAREGSDDPASAAHAAADALLRIWPSIDHTPETAPLVESLRANAGSLHALSGTILWHPDGHDLLYQAGYSLLSAGLHATAVTYWRTIAEQAQQVLGPKHPDTLTARANLAASYGQAGRTDDAITIMELVIADRERILGPEHPSTLTARVSLAGSYWQAGRTNAAITIMELVFADSERILGPEHPDTLNARANLASSYWQAGRTDDAITIDEQVLADSERILGPEHRETLAARANLAASYRQAGRTDDAITIDEQVLADRERILGPEHRDTLTARANLAASSWQAGRTNDAIAILKLVLADRERILGSEHPDTIAAASVLRAWTAAGS